jgi:threonine dehydratase
MPEDAPLLKRDRAARLGATVQLFDRVKDDREALATRLCGSRKALLVPPFDDPEIVAGQGTVAIEILEAVEARLDAIYVPCGGGGLISGVGLAFNACSPETGVIAVEPVGFDDLARSLRSGIKERNPSATGTICDALQAASTGVLTYEMAKRYVQAGVTVRDDQVRDAMRFAFRELKVVVEPGGAVGLAAVLAGAPLKGKTVAVVVSGGNADPFLYASIIAKA